MTFRRSILSCGYWAGQYKSHTSIATGSVVGQHCDRLDMETILRDQDRIGFSGGNSRELVKYTNDGGNSGKFHISSRGFGPNSAKV